MKNKKIGVYMGDLEFRFDAESSEWVCSFIPYPSPIQVSDDIPARAAETLASELRSIADAISHKVRRGEIK